MFDNPVMLAFIFGGLSAISLPIGAVIGLWTRPGAKVVAGVMAFGAGALICALTLELVASALTHFPTPKEGFVPLALGAALGCLVFIGLDQVFSNMGGFLRKASTLTARLKQNKKQAYSDLLGKLSKVDILASLPPAEVRAIVHHVEDRFFPAGTVVFSQGGYGDSLYLIESGKVEVLVDGPDGRKTIAVLGEGETFGEMALLSGEPRNATVVASEALHTWEIHRDDFADLLRTSPSLKKAVDALATARHEGKTSPVNAAASAQWAKEATQNLENEVRKPTSTEIAQLAQDTHAKGGSNVALAMWLGIALDGVPESLCIGSSMDGSAVSLALIGGLFMANLPESMSSAVVMKNQGSSTSKIIWMWVSLTIMTAVGAALGNMFISEVPHFTKALLEGMAAGAMLAMVAQTMLPEAFEHGGWLTGMMTVAGFLAAIFMGTLEEKEEKRAPEKHSAIQTQQTIHAARLEAGSTKLSDKHWETVAGKS